MMNFNPVVSHPETADVLNLYMKKLKEDLNCHAIATIQSLDTTKLTVSATINYSRTLVNIDQQTGKYNFTQIPYPTLADIPLVIMSGGTSSLTFPVIPGDQCLLFFNDRDMDNWFVGARNGPVNSNRLHHLSDAIAIVGLIPTLPSAYSQTHAILQNGKTQVGVSNSKVLINNEADNSLGFLLGTLCTDLATVFTALATAMTSLGQTAAATACTTVVSQLTVLDTEITGLLE